MSVKYTKLWKLLIEREMKKTDLIPLAGISSNVLAKMGRNEYISMESAEKICKALHCEINEIIEFNMEEVNE